MSKRKADETEINPNSPKEPKTGESHVNWEDILYSNHEDIKISYEDSMSQEKSEFEVVDYLEYLNDDDEYTEKLDNLTNSIEQNKIDSVTLKNVFEDDVKEISELLKNNTSATRLSVEQDFSDEEYEDEDFGDKYNVEEYESDLNLTELFKHNKTIKEFFVDNIVLPLASWKNIVEGIKGNNVVETIHIRNLQEEHLKEAFETLVYTPSIKAAHLIIDKHGIESNYEGTDLNLGLFLESNPNITELSIEGISLGKEYWKSIFESINKNNTLKKLTLNLNKLIENAIDASGVDQSEAFCEIFEALESNTSITQLTIKANSDEKKNLSLNSIEKIGRLLKRNKTIEELTIDNNLHLSAEEYAALFNMLAKKNNLKSLNLDLSRFDMNNSIDALINLIKKRNVLTNLNLNYTNLSYDNTLKLFKALEESKSLQTINLGNILNSRFENLNYNIEAQDNLLKALIESLKKNESITKVIINGENFIAYNNKGVFEDKTRAEQIEELTEKNKRIFESVNNYASLINRFEQRNKDFISSENGTLPIEIHKLILQKMAPTNHSFRTAVSRIESEKKRSK